MRKYNEDTKITFYAGLGYIHGNRDETQTLLEMDLTNEEIEEMTDKEVEEHIEEHFEIFLGNCLDAGWYEK